MYMYILLVSFRINLCLNLSIKQRVKKVEMEIYCKQNTYIFDISTYFTNFTFASFV